jgi:hypothetical protein
MKKKGQSLNSSDVLSVASGGYTNINIGEGTTSTSISTFTIQDEKKLESVNFIENEEGNFIEITYSLISNYNLTYTVTFTVNPPAKRMVKERYGVVDGKMQLIKTIYGKENAGYYVPASTEWEE